LRHSHLTLDVAGAIAGAENLTKYDSVDADVIQSYSEYSLASLLYYAMKVGNLDYFNIIFSAFSWLGTANVADPGCLSRIPYPTTKEKKKK
jgi:hypothetical protein